MTKSCAKVYDDSSGEWDFSEGDEEAVVVEKRMQAENEEEAQKLKTQETEQRGSRNRGIKRSRLDADVAEEDGDDAEALAARERGPLGLRRQHVAPLLPPLLRLHALGRGCVVAHAAELEVGVGIINRFDRRRWKRARHG